jgi:hypothetical protein
MHRLAGHPIALGDLGHRNPRQDLQHRAVSLLDHVQLPKHERERHRSSGATVSHIKRSRACPGRVRREKFLYGKLSAGAYGRGAGPPRRPVTGRGSAGDHPV